MGNERETLKELMRELTETPGPSGNEAPVRKVMEKWVKPYADELTSDGLGSLIARKGSKGPRVMIAGHLDEIGFMVTRITDEGFLKFETLGGWVTHMMLSQRVEVMTDKGIILGVIGSVPPHIMTAEQRKKSFQMSELFIDIGAKDREHAEEMGVRQGDTVVPYSPFTEMNGTDMWLGKAFDNRIGCAVAVEVMRQLQNEALPNALYSVGTVQEEVGCRGARTSAAAIQPDIAFAVDVGIAGDTPGVKADDAPIKVGEGPALVLVDGGHVVHRGLLRFVQQTAEEAGIPVQYEWMNGGATDASYIHLNNSGVPTISISVPTRYIHGHTAMVLKDDIEQVVALLTAVIRKLDEQAVKQILEQ
ncbi:M42 family metallopeptidase [Mechercharimyces sp. CAU 1602]|uniref:M42 family metallopeptidase n=1 Tax=Mechercharimyces sp. CAU 1602 TaxID=2973933 RepID=UPI0021620B0F|nr:M42 family metallopeptidase [Mechercharimyces sp. CAU 1602]MCS1351558.1 M42 family metallopeptidase [Mechercharimyces sp. CAU 1602]